MAARNPGGERDARLAPRISRGRFFLAVFFRVTHDGQSEKGTARSLSALFLKTCLAKFTELVRFGACDRWRHKIIFYPVYLTPKMKCW